MVPMKWGSKGSRGVWVLWVYKGVWECLEWFRDGTPTQNTYQQEVCAPTDVVGLKGLIFSLRPDEAATVWWLQKLVSK